LVATKNRTEINNQLSEGFLRIINYNNDDKYSLEFKYFILVTINDIRNSLYDN